MLVPFDGCHSILVGIVHMTHVVMIYTCIPHLVMAVSLRFQQGKNSRYAHSFSFLLYSRSILCDFLLYSLVHIQVCLLRHYISLSAIRLNHLGWCSCTIIEWCRIAALRSLLLADSKPGQNGLFENSV